MKPFLSYLVASLLVCGTTFGASTPSSSQTLIKKRVLADLDCIHHIFDVKYAPKGWKYDFAGWDLDQAIATAKRQITNLSSPSLKECQVILRDFFNSTKDYHVGIRFFSTESASLPFLVKEAQGRYFVCYVEDELASKKAFPFGEGDEITKFGDRPIHEVVEDLRKNEFGENTIETDRALATLMLTQRRGDMGHLVPSGNIKITGLKKNSEQPLSVVLQWHYIPERIRDFSKLNLMAVSSNPLIKQPKDLSTALKTSGFFEKFMVSHLWDKSYVGHSLATNKHTLGTRCSFLPPLGKKVWKPGPDTLFDAYICLTEEGQRIGYIRIPHYVGDEEEVEEFGFIMNHFQRTTDALVIDQLNNPGGSIFYLYGLVSTLTDKPLYAPKHRIAITQEEVYVAHYLLPYLEQVTNDDTARKVLGENLGGYPVDFQFIQLMKQFCHFMIQQWESGKLYSDPTFLFGVDKVNPHPSFRYTKPILLLTNSLDFSGGDFLPAVLQDNKRVTILGTRTAGAGGYVLTTDYPNHSGIKHFLLTGSLAERINRKPIENLGVTPDIQYDLSVTDLQENYKEYVEAILETVVSLAKGN